MGCFDSNCCVTDLPIKEGDPIMMGLLEYEDHHGKCYVGSSYKFVLLPIQGIYNDYGFTDWENVPEEDLNILETSIKPYQPHITSSYDKEIEEKRKCFKTAFELLFHQQAEFYIDKENHLNYQRWISSDRSTPKPKQPDLWAGKYIIKPFMCHKWAFDEVRNLQEYNLGACDEEQLKPQYILPTIEEYNHAMDMKQEHFYSKENPTPEDYEIYREFNKVTGCENRNFGEQDGISMFWKHRLMNLELNEQQREPLFQRFKITHHFCRNLYFLRKPLRELNNVGPQHDNFKIITQFSKLIGQKAREGRKNRDF